MNQQGSQKLLKTVIKAKFFINFDYIMSTRI